ncbi:MAG: CheR family methyltransferase [Bacteroidota bacterium]
MSTESFHNGQLHQIPEIKFGQLCSDLNSSPDSSSILEHAHSLYCINQALIPELFSNVRGGETLRIWMPHCTTGEEVYTLAALVQHYQLTHNTSSELKIFGTDPDPELIETAKSGIIAPRFKPLLNNKLWEPYFEWTGHHIQVDSVLRDIVHFSIHNIYSNPPHVSIDWLHLGDLLHTSSTEQFDYILDLLHFALKPYGFVTTSKHGSDIFSKLKFRNYCDSPYIYRHIPDRASEFVKGSSISNFDQSESNLSDQRTLLSPNAFPLDKVNWPLQNLNDHPLTKLDYSTLDRAKEVMNRFNRPPQANQTNKKQSAEVKLSSDGSKPSEIETIILNTQHQIEYITEQVSNIFDITSEDIGRSIYEIDLHLDYHSLRKDINKAQATGDTIIKKVHDKVGHIYDLHISCTNCGSEHAGIVLNFENVTSLSDSEYDIIMHAQEQETLAQLSNFALREHNIDLVIDRAIKHLCSVLSFDYGYILQLSDDHETAHIIGSSIPLMRDEQHIPMERTLDAFFAVRYGEPLIVSDYSDAPGLHRLPFMEKTKITSGLLITFGESYEQSGIITLYSEQRKRFTMHDVNFAQIVSNIIGNAIERKQAESQLAQTNIKLQQEINRNQEYQREILKNDVLERWKVGAYLHEDLAQSLVFAKLSLEDAIHQVQNNNLVDSANWDSVKEILDEGISEVRSLSHEIVPIDVNEDGLYRAFKHLVQRTSKVYRVKVDFESESTVDAIANTELATNLYRVVQEALKNAALHTNAEHILLKLRSTDFDFFIEVLDDGILPELNEKNIDLMGLNIMRHRMEVLGGTLELDTEHTAPPYTTRIVFRLPLEKLNGDND